MKAPRRFAPALLGAIVWATASLVGCGALAGPVAAASAPVVQLDTQVAEIGQYIHITGSGWSPVGQTVQIQLCGRNAQNLSADCDQSNQYTAAIRAGGVFYGALTVRPPPTPCPCVVEVANQSETTARQVPITIIGAATAPIPPPTPAGPPHPVTVSAKLLTPVSVSAWFGGPRAVTLVLHVTNVSSLAYPSPALTVNVGKGSKPSTFVVGKPLAPLAPGATQVLRIPVALPAFTAGHYSVRAQVITPKGTVTTVVHTSTFPWGLVVVGAIIVLAIVLLIWRRTRRRRRARLQPSPGPGSGPSPGSGDGPGGGEPAPGPQEVART